MISDPTARRFLDPRDVDHPHWGSFSWATLAAKRQSHAGQPAFLPIPTSALIAQPDAAIVPEICAEGPRQFADESPR